MDSKGRGLIVHGLLFPMRLCKALSARRQYLDGVHAGTRRLSAVDVAVRPATVTDTEPHADIVPRWKLAAGVRCVPKKLQPDLSPKHAHRCSPSPCSLYSLLAVSSGDQGLLGQRPDICLSDPPDRPGRCWPGRAPFPVFASRNVHPPRRLSRRSCSIAASSPRRCPAPLPRAVGAAVLAL